jgi:hypothetical protein
VASFRTDQILWYNNGYWGTLGYAVPNFGDDPTTLNQNIHYLVQEMGRYLFLVMHHHDADLTTAPSVNTVKKIHGLVTRARGIIAARSVPLGQPDMENIHATPAPLEHLIYPVPYFKVRNPHLKQYAQLILAAISEAMQHTENRKPVEISTVFGATIAQYLRRVYVMMATELFGVPVATAQADTFALSDTEFKNYDPYKVGFISTEPIDTVPPLGNVPTEDDLAVLAYGIPATKLLNLQHYSSGRVGEANTGPTTTATGTETGAAATATAAGGGAAWPTNPAA